MNKENYDRSPIFESTTPIFTTSSSGNGVDNLHCLENGDGITASPIFRRTSSIYRNRGSKLSFHDIKFKVAVPRGFCKRKEIKQIIHGVTGIFKPGINVIMGPTGGGKTTILNILAGRTDTSLLEGDILVDGLKQPSNFRCMSGFVAQDDIIMGTLTVRENLMFSANLRLSSKISNEEKMNQVDEIIYELGLIDCADIKIGAELERGVSGDERKRTCIGIELIISPRVLFLDEPTTGLDSSTAFAVMSLLKSISQKGKTIIFSIHQPRYNIYKLFDNLLLLGAGRTIYHGAANAALDYFHSIGYFCDEHENPSDFFLDVTNGDSTAIQALNNPNKYGDDNEVTSTDINCKSFILSLAEKYSKSPEALKIYEEANDIHKAFKSSQMQNVKSPKISFETSFIKQLFYVAQRATKNITRNINALLLQTVIMITFGIFIGVIFYKLGFYTIGAIQNRAGAFYFVIMHLIFSNLSSLELLIKERTIFRHECSGGFYRVSAYFLAKYFCDVIPMRLFPLLLFCPIIYFMIGYQLAADKFFLFLLTMSLTAISSSAVCFAISASVTSFSIAHLAITFVYVFMQVFGGFLANITTMPAWLSWLQYFSIARFAINALSIAEFKTLVLYDDNGTALRDEGIVYLGKQGIKYESDWDFWQNELAMGIISVGLLVIAYIQLLRNSRNH